MIVHVEAVRAVDEAQPGDLFPGRWERPENHPDEPAPALLCCPGCAKLVSIPHRVEVHEDGTVSLWNPAGVGREPRSFVCPLCGFHAVVNRGKIERR